MSLDAGAGATHAPAPDVSGGGRIFIIGPTTIERIPLSTVRVPSNRHAMDVDFICEGVLTLLANPAADLPPILVLRAGPALHWLIEGRHRFASNLAAGRADILAVVAEHVEIPAQRDASAAQAQR